MFADLRCSPSCTRAGVHGTVSMCPPDCFQYRGTLDVFYKIIRQVGGVWHVFNICGINAHFLLLVHQRNFQWPNWRVTAGRIFQAVERHKCWFGIGCTNGKFLIPAGEYQH